MLEATLFPTNILGAVAKLFSFDLRVTVVPVVLPGPVETESTGFGGFNEGGFVFHTQTTELVTAAEPRLVESSAVICSEGMLLKAGRAHLGFLLETVVRLFVRLLLGTVVVSVSPFSTIMTS